MTGLVRKATLFAVCGLLTAATAFANVPSPGQSSVPAWIPLVGTNAGVVHPGKSITVTVNDFLGNPIQGSACLFDFSGMVDVRLCTAVVAGVGTVNCGSGTVLASTDALGQVSITVLGGGNNQFGLAPGAGAGAGQMYADGVPMGTFSSTILDQNGAVGGDNVTGLDLSLALADVNSFGTGGPYVARTDFTNDGSSLTGLDMSFMLADSNSLGSATGCNDGGSDQPYCP